MLSQLRKKPPPKINKKINLTQGYIYAFIVSDAALDPIEEYSWGGDNKFTKLQNCFYIIPFEEIKNAFNDSRKMCNHMIEKEINWPISKAGRFEYVKWSYEIDKKIGFVNYEGIIDFDSEDLIEAIIDLNEFDYSELPSTDVLCVKSTQLKCYNHGYFVLSTIPVRQINKTNVSKDALYYDVISFISYNIKINIIFHLKDCTKKENFYKKTRVKYISNMEIRYME